MAYSLYLIRNTRDTDLYYAEHGEIGGVPDAVGYHDLEIARMFQVKPGEIKLEMDQARSKVVPFPTETAALAA